MKPIIRALALWLCAATCAAPALAQNGIVIDAEGVVSAAFSRRESVSLKRKREAAFTQAHLPEEILPFSELRAISLRGLEQAIRQTGAHTVEDLPHDIQYLYGLQRLDYVFLDLERADILLAGPAEGFAPDSLGRMIGLTTGRPPIRLDDLLVALRWAETNSQDIGCSIDPRPERLNNLNRWLQQNSTATTRSAAARRFPTMAQILGEQDVRIWGVPNDSHFAQVLIEADYRMKLIAMGKENPRVRGLRSHLSMLAPNGNSIQRWWFVPLYEPIQADEEDTSFRFSGQRAQVLASDEWADRSGRLQDAAFTRASTTRFAQQFTEHFPKLAEKSAGFAELQNVFDLAVLAALLRQEQARERLNWKMELFLDAEALAIKTYPVPKTIRSLVATTNRSRFVLGLVGGVTLTAREIVHRKEVVDSSRPMASLGEAVRSPSSSGRETPFWDVPRPGGSD